MAASALMKSIKVQGTFTPELHAFIEQWDSDAPGITANTSGSTGAPKQIMLSRNDMLMSANATCQYFNITANSILGLPLSAGYIAGKMMAVRTLVSGATLYIEAPSNRPLESWSGPNISLLSVVPSQIRYLLKSGRLKMADKLLIGGSPLPPDLESALLDVGYTEAYVSYGMTETCSHVAIRRIGCNVYEALPGTQFSVDNRECLRITTTGAEYSPVTTNDIVELTDATHFRWMGRYDNVVISGGLKLMPESIERKIAPLLEGVSFVIYGRPSSRWGEELVMMVESPEPIQNIAQLLRDALPPFEIPKEILYTDKLERTNGKIKRPEKQ